MPDERYLMVILRSWASATPQSVMATAMDTTTNGKRIVPYRFRTGVRAALPATPRGWQL